jgi:uncharacterized membrane protein YbhN (UPF0104 family)
MIKRYLAKRNNPWELLLLAFVMFVPGVLLFLQTRYVLLFSQGGTLTWHALFSPVAAHIFGAVVVAFSVFLVVVYFYALRSIARDEKAPPPHFLDSQH